MTAVAHAVANSNSGTARATNGSMGGESESTLNGRKVRVRLFSADEEPASSEAKALYLMAWLTGRLVPSHWPKGDGASQYKEAAREYLLEQKYIKDLEPEVSRGNLARAMKVYKLQNGPGYVGVFLKTGTWSENIKLVD